MNSCIVVSAPLSNYVSLVLTTGYPTQHLAHENKSADVFETHKVLF